MAAAKKYSTIAGDETAASTVMQADILAGEFKHLESMTRPAAETPLCYRQNVSEGSWRSDCVTVQTMRRLFTSTTSYVIRTPKARRVGENIYGILSTHGDYIFAAHRNLR